jgi:NTE family protein
VTTALVLDGGGLPGAHEVGMPRVLTETGVRPDVVVGTSIGKATLQLVPGPDVVANRPPNTFVQPGAAGR